MRHLAADALGQPLARLGAGAAHQLDQHLEGFEPAVGAAALVGQFVGRLLPGHVDFADQVQVGHEHVVEEDLVEIVLRRSG